VPNAKPPLPLPLEVEGAKLNVAAADVEVAVVDMAAGTAAAEEVVDGGATPKPKVNCGAAEEEGVAVVAEVVVDG
jgi:hypothetical protein